jgi:hypothetical protein
VNTRAGRSVRTVRMAVAVVLATAVLAVQPAPARADTFANNFFPAHWGPMPYLTVPPGNVFYRSVGLIDNTGDPSLSAQIQSFVNAVNYVQAVYNPNYPVLLYFKDAFFTPGSPCALAPAQYLVICKDETLGGTGSAGAPGSAAIFPDPANHIRFAIARIRPSVVDPWCAGDKFTVVAQLLSNTLGIDQNLTNPASALFPTIPIGRCTFNGWTNAEFHRMNQMYSHAAG